MITYRLDLSSWIRGATLKEEHSSTILSDHSDVLYTYNDGYTAGRLIHEEWCDLQAVWIHQDGNMEEH